MNKTFVCFTYELDKMSVVSIEQVLFFSFFYY